MNSQRILRSYFSPVILLLFSAGMYAAVLLFVDLLIVRPSVILNS